MNEAQSTIPVGELPDDIAEGINRALRTLNDQEEIYGRGMSIAERLEHALSYAHQGDVNCYPGRPGAGCFDTCYIWSLKPEDPHDKGRGHLEFDRALRALRNHADKCQLTRRLILVTNEWWAPTFKDWVDTLDRLRREGRDVYMVLLTSDRGYTVLDV